MATIAALPLDGLKQARVREVENALASVRMEGQEPSEEVKSLFQRYVDGDLTSEQLDHEILLHFDREYGSVRLPENERS
jgi:hypothetical protein